jgi:hypothetical protein
MESASSAALSVSESSLPAHLRILDIELRLMPNESDLHKIKLSCFGKTTGPCTSSPVASKVLPAIGTQQEADQSDVARVHCLQRNAGIRAIEIRLCHEFLKENEEYQGQRQMHIFTLNSLTLIASTIFFNNDAWLKRASNIFDLFTGLCGFFFFFFFFFCAFQLEHSTNR